MPSASGKRSKGDGGGSFVAVVIVLTVIVIFVMDPPAASVAGVKIADAPAGRPLAAKLTLYRNVVATWG